MSHHSLFTCALASISFLAGGLVQAGDYFISNEENYNTSIADTLGIPLSSGCAMLGTLTNWNYNFNDAKWANGGNEYDQGNLSYSQMSIFGTILSARSTSVLPTTDLLPMADSFPCRGHTSSLRDWPWKIPLFI